MRDPDRIDFFLDKIKDIWRKECPDWRFGQLVVNVFSTLERDPFFYEEDEMLEAFSKYFTRGEK